MASEARRRPQQINRGRASCATKFCPTNATTDCKWKAVMGPRKVGIKTAVVPIASLIVQIMCLTSAVIAGKSQDCVFEHCSRQYQDTIELNGLFRGANARYCSVLRNYLECLRSNARGCRGNLKYHTTSTFVVQWINEYNCTYIRAPLEEEPLIPTVVATPSPKCLYRGRQTSVTCALFGDPHLTTFYQENQTCKVLGAWPLIDNEYLAVQVTNQAVVKGLTASATSEITIIVKQHRPCTEEKTYEAVKDNLPSTFVDGSQSSGIDKSVLIDEKIPGHHVEIWIKYIGTVIVIRRVGHYLTFAISIPREVAHLEDTNTDGLELCVKGCPNNERINHQNVVVVGSSSTHLAMSREDAISRCKLHNLTNFYLESCVFDLMTTGDDSFLQAANQAMIDYNALNPGSKDTPKSSVEPMESRPWDGVPIASCAKGVFSISQWILVILMLFLLRSLVNR